MSRFAPVVPLQIARVLKEEGLLGNYHLLLAHDVRAWPTEYKQVYGDLVQDPKSIVIMDNSVVELGEAVDIAWMVEACTVIKSNYLVIPDVMSNHVGTITAAQQFVREYEKVPVSQDVPLMGVIQGKTLDECISCAFNLAELPGVEALAIPRVVTKWMGSRMEVVYHVLDDLPGFFIHLLGFSDNLLDDVACCRLPGVSGIDSAVPIRAAHQQMRLNLNYKQDYGPRGDFWKADPGSLPTTLTAMNLGDIRRWIV